MLLRRVLQLLVAVSAIGCSAAPTSESIASKRAVIVVPGFKGSLLQSSSGKRVWITPSEALFGSRSLALPAPGVRDPVIAHPDGILRSLTVLGFFGDTYYGPFLDSLRRECRKVRVVEFSYDWRKSASESAGELATLIRTLQGEGIQAVDIVAHSFGGLVTTWFLRFGAQSIGEAADSWSASAVVEKVVLAGVPFQGAFQIFHDLKTGSVQGLNAKILDQEALSTFPSSFELLPYGSHGSAAYSFDVGYWEQQKLGLFANEGLWDEKRTFVRDRLIQAALFKQKLLADSAGPPTNDRPKMLVVVGSQPETAAVEPAAEGSFEANVLVEGDDTVSAESATPPRSFLDRYQWVRIRTRLPHYRLLDDERIPQFLCSPDEGLE